MLQYLQKHQDNLTPQQQNVLQQLSSQYRLMQQHQQQLRLQQQQQRAQQQQQQQVLGSQPQSGRVPTQQQSQSQFLAQQQQGFQRVPQTGTVAQTGFSVDSSGNFPAATGHTVQNAGMPYKSANIGGFDQQNQQFKISNGGYTQITSTTNQPEMGECITLSLFKINYLSKHFLINHLFFVRRYRPRITSITITKRYCNIVS